MSLAQDYYLAAKQASGEAKSVYEAVQALALITQAAIQIGLEGEPHKDIWLKELERLAHSTTAVVSRNLTPAYLKDI